MIKFYKYIKDINELVAKVSENMNIFKLEIRYFTGYAKFALQTISKDLDLFDYILNLKNLIIWKTVCKILTRF